MKPEDALRAITRTPALVFGQEDTGIIRPGARADLVAWSGDPLALASRPLEVLVGGRQLRLESRQTRLRDRYRDLPDGRVLPAAPLPPSK